MKYDFETIYDRRGTDSLKWDVKDNELPMWVADMDFKAAPEILDAIGERLSHGIMGYPVIPDRWRDAYVNWWERRHGLKMQREGLIFCAGIIPAISSLVKTLTAPGGNVLIQPPVYNAFFNLIKNNGRKIQENPLIYRDGRYEMDFEDLDIKLSDPETKLMILCNPHNPSGNIWSEEDLSRVGELAAKHGVTVISDEIHCDLTDPGKGYIPFALASSDFASLGITCIAPTKAFNLAGLKTSAVYIESEELRAKVKAAFDTDELTEANSFSSIAAITAFEKGGDWLDELRQVVFGNKRTVEEYAASEIPEITVVKGEATYLLWLDISGLGGDVSEFQAFLRKETGLFLSPGIIFGEQGRAFLRMNVACPHSVLMDGLKRLKKGAEAFMGR